MLIPIILLSVICFLFLIEASVLWRYTPLNRVQRNLLYVIIIWFVIFLMVYIESIRNCISDISPQFGLMNFRSICMASIGIISLAYLISTVLYAKQREVVKSLAWGIPLIFTVIVYIVWSLLTDTPINYRYSTIEELWQESFSFTVILRMLIVLQIIWILISITSSVWRLIPLYNKYSEDNYADSYYNINWIRMAVKCTFTISSLYFVMIFTAHPISILMYTLSVCVSFILITDKAIFYKEFTPPRNIDVYWDYWRGWTVKPQVVDDTPMSIKKIEQAGMIFDKWISESKAYKLPNFSSKDVYNVLPDLDAKTLIILLEQRGYTFQSYVRKLRIDEACALLERDRTLSNKELAHEVGLSSDSAFSRAFTAVKGISPTKYKKNIKLSYIR